MAQKSLKVGAIQGVSGEVSIAGRDVIRGYTADQVSTLLAQIKSTFQPRPFDGRCPYKGLDIFEEEDAELFFGREKLIEDLVGRVKASRAVFITGPSGSGKSSLVRAGLIHALKQGASKDLRSERWLYETMKPGRDPMGELARIVSGLAGTTGAGDEILAKGLEDATILARWFEIALKDGRDKRVVLFIDQFEEVFTQISKEEQRQAFLDLLTHAATVPNGRTTVLFAMRSDFVSDCATYPDLNALISRQFIQVGAMQPNELVSAIAEPALRVGLRVDPDLVAQIISDMQGEPGALPLMQFALKDLFDAENEKGGIIALTLQAYLQRGGIHKSLERHADDSFAKLSENEQELARVVFSSLIEIGRGTQDTRRTALFNELVPADAKADEVGLTVQKLADARLVTTGEQAGRDTVTLSHEKLIDAWPWLKRLVNENRDSILLQNEIASDAQEWDDHQRDASYLYRGARLANAREQLESKKLVLSDLGQAFIEAGISAHADELETAKKRATQLRRRSVYLSVALLVALIAAGAAAYAGFLSQREARNAFARQLAAKAQSVNATRNSNQMTAVLLALQSMKILPSVEASQLLAGNTMAPLVARMSHDDWVNSVAFSPSGRYVVSGSDDGTIRVWDASNGEEIVHMAHDDAVNTVAFSPDGSQVVSGSDDGTARIWDVSTGGEVARMTHDDAVNTVAFSPDGLYAASGSDDGTARVWEISSGKEVTRISHDDRVSTVAFSPDGGYVVSGSWDSTARVWNATTGKEVGRMIHADWVRSAAFSPDGRYAASTSNDGTISVWEVFTGTEIAHMGHPYEVVTVGFSPDGTYLVSGGQDGTVRVWEAASGKELARMIHDRLVYSAVFSPDGKYILSGSRDGTARVWEAATGREIARMTHDDAVRSVAFSPDGKYAISGSNDGSVRVWKTSTGSEVQVPHVHEMYAIAFSPDGGYAASGSDEGTILVWHVASGTGTSKMAHDDYVNSVAFSPDGKYVASGSGDNTARIWDAFSGAEIARFGHDGIVNSVTFSPDGKFLATGSWDNTARVWEIATGNEIARMTHDDWVESVAFSPDGKFVSSGSDDGAVRVWEAATGKETARMEHDDGVESVTFSPDGRYVLSMSWDHTARVWEASTGKKIAQMTHEDIGRRAAFSPDGKFVVTSSEDNTLRVWDAMSGTEITRITHDDPGIFVGFSADGKQVVSAGYDGMVYSWLWRTSDLADDACARLPRNLTSTEWKQYIGDTLPYQAVCSNLPVEPEATPTPEAQ